MSCEAQSHDSVDCMDGHESAKVVVMYNILCKICGIIR
jgi:hypothetical protein